MLLRPWAIHVTGYDAVPQVLFRHEFFARHERVVAMFGDEREPAGEDAKPYELVGNVGVVKVCNTLFRAQNDVDEMIARFFGITTYGAIARGVAEAMAAPETRAVLLDVNSVGGDTDGVAECAEAIYRARKGGKPIVALIRGYGASAAYWLASATERIYVGESTAMIGCIGTKVLCIDDAGLAEKMGVRVFEVVSEQTPDKRQLPLDEEVVARVQAHCNRLTDIFFDDVSRNRKVSRAKVQGDFGKGDVLIGDDAIRAGLADESITYDELVAKLGAELPAAPAPSTANSSAPRAQARTTITPPPRADGKRRPTMTVKNKFRSAKEEYVDEADDLDEKAKGKRAEAKSKRAEAKRCEAEADEHDKDGESDKAEAKRAEAKRCEAEADELEANADEMESKAKTARAKADAEDGDGKHDEPDGDEKAMAMFRAALGVEPTASAREMWRAFSAKFARLDTVAELRKEIASLKARDEERTTREITAQASRAAEAAVAEGRQEESKRELLVEAFVEAEQKKVGTGQAALERHLFGKGTFGRAGAVRELSQGGRPLAARGGGPGHDPGSPSGERRPAARDGGPLGGIARVGTALVERANALMAQNPKLSFDEASRMAYAEDPSLYA